LAGLKRVEIIDFENSRVPAIQADAAQPVDPPVSLLSCRGRIRIV
jgi:hypothetical protein